MQKRKITPMRVRDDGDITDGDSVVLGITRPGCIPSLSEHFFLRHPEMQPVVDAVAKFMAIRAVGECLASSVAEAVKDATSGELGNLSRRVAHKARASARKRARLLAQVRVRDAIAMFAPYGIKPVVLNAAANIIVRGNMLLDRIDRELDQNSNLGDEVKRAIAAVENSQ